jgi:hypothetical protein
MRCIKATKGGAEENAQEQGVLKGNCISRVMVFINRVSMHVMHRNKLKKRDVSILFFMFDKMLEDYRQLQ